VVSDEVRAIRIAATHVLGFRATLGCVRLTQLSAETGTRHTVLDGEPGEVAASVFHAGEEQRRAIGHELAGRAAIHADAHLAKYTMACLIAAARDLEAAPLYL